MSFSTPRIAYLTSHYARASDSFIRGEVRELRAMGCEVSTFSIRTPDNDESVSDEIRRERAQTQDMIRQPVTSLLLAAAQEALRQPLRFLKTARLAWKATPPGAKSGLLAAAYTIEAAWLARRLRELRVEHLHNHIGESSATVAMLASKFSGIPYSLTIHGPNEFDKATIMGLDHKVAHAAFAVAISRFGRSQLYRWTRSEDWPKVCIVRCGVDDSFLVAPMERVPDTPRLVSVGRLAEQKGQLLLVEAAAQLAAEGIAFELRLIGDGPLRGMLEENIRRHGIESYVKLLGWKSTRAIRDELLRSRAFVLPSLGEGLPVVLMEAMALRRPVVTTWIAGIPELVEDGINGWLVPPGDVDSLVAAMRKVLFASTETLDAMGKDGATRVRQQHNAETEVGRLLNLIRASIAGKNLSQPIRRENQSDSAGVPASQQPSQPRIL